MHLIKAYGNQGILPCRRRSLNTMSIVVFSLHFYWQPIVPLMKIMAIMKESVYVLLVPL